MTRSPISAFEFRGAQTPVRSQGTRPTCAAFAATAAHEWMCGDGPDLSEEFALWAAKRRDGLGGEATTAKAALRGMHEEGQPGTSAWPYGQPAFPAPPPAAAMNVAARRVAEAARLLPSGRVDHVSAALVAGDAVVLSLGFVPPAWYQAFNDGWIHAAPGSPTVGGHAVLAVGVETSPRAAIIVKNSWGPGWGDDGYGYVEAAYLDEYAWVAHALPPSPARAA